MRTLAAALALLTFGPAPTAPAPDCPGVRPGGVLVVPLTPPVDPRPFPTFGFVFNGSDGRVYATTAGHVALGLEGGERTWSGGGTVASDVGGRRVGEFVYAINTRAQPAPDLPPGADVALIRVDDGVDVVAEVCGIGGPRGRNDALVAPPEVVEHRWFGAAVVIGRVGHPVPAEGPWLVPARSGVSAGMPSPYWVTVAGHASFGDSGAPVLDADGLAIGWVSGPPNSAEELAQPGSFVVSRVGPAIERASRVLGITLALAEA